MKTLISIIFISLSGISYGIKGDSLTITQPIQEHLIVQKAKPFFIEGDWLLETKAELINEISYSPTLEFNLTKPKGFNFQIQTGALPIVSGFKIDKTQPAAGFSFGYKF